MTKAAPDRSVHLVGTVPAADAAAAFELFASTLDGHLPRWIPDGETGDRLDWVLRIVEDLRRHPDLELAREGDWSDYDTTPYFKVRRGHRFETLDLDYSRYFAESWPAFEEFRRERTDAPGLQIGIPSHVDLALIAFGFKPAAALAHLAPFRDATVREITKIDDRAGDNVVFQLEIPIPLILLTRVPARLRSVVARVLAAELVKVVRRSPGGTRFGIHLCYGDMNHKAMGDPEDSAPLVQLSNAVVRAWPTSQRLEFVHAPFARGQKPPPLDVDFYAPLANLRLPHGMMFAAGIIHEELELDDLRMLRDRIEGLVGRPVDVGAACGLGRRDAEKAKANLELSRAVAGG
ncbi:MAG TPA: hypothetical protein VLB85_01050 [Acidimicrobiia bacterium]|nr:hypothetical protein [Acidimicrobiia bacterium]